VQGKTPGVAETMGWQVTDEMDLSRWISHFRNPYG